VVESQRAHNTDVPGVVNKQRIQNDTNQSIAVLIEKGS